MTREEAIGRLRMIAATTWRDLDPAAVGVEMLEVAPLVVAELDDLRFALKCTVEAAHKGVGP